MATPRLVTAVVLRWTVAADGGLRLLVATTPLDCEATFWRVRDGDKWEWRVPAEPSPTVPVLDAAAAAALARLAKPVAHDDADLLTAMVREHPVLSRIADQFGLADTKLR